MTSTSATQWREMARRAGDGSEIAVLWNGSLNRVKVTVSDSRLCRYLDLEVSAPDALTAFHDQFADAAVRLSPRDLEADLSERLSQASDQEGPNT